MPGAIVTVSQLCRYVKSLLEEQKPLADLLVKGEIASLSYRSASGHLYFSLLDGDSCIRCVMFNRYAQKLATLPEEGTLAVVRGAVSLYERDGSFQLLAYDLQELGGGNAQKALEELKKKLYAQGLFAESRKRPLPAFPKAVGVVTSADGAALHDIITTFRQHNPLVKLIVYPATVQGAGAPASIIAALDALQGEALCDSCVIARGGGSSEDLSAFNDETLVRRAAAMPIPVVSAVGHEVDYSLLDMVADARAATPTAACRLLAAPASRLQERVTAQQTALEKRINQRLERAQQQIKRLQLQLYAKSPQSLLEKNRQRADFLVKSLEMQQRIIIERLQRRTLGLLDRLELVNPTHLLRRGYSITSLEGRVITQSSQAAPQDILTTQMMDGKIISAVLRIERE